jgi:hypothetical protein
MKLPSRTGFAAGATTAALAGFAALAGPAGAATHGPAQRSQPRRLRADRQHRG